MFRSVGLGLLVWQLVTASALVNGLTASGTDVDVTVFLNDDVFQLNSTRPSPLDLGSYPYECVGDVRLCPNGFSLGLWYRPTAGSVQTPHSYILSSGAQSALSPGGIYLRQNYGEEYEVGVAVQSQLWSVSFNLLGFGTWTHVALTFSSSAGLTVYVDGLAVGTNATGSGRFYVPSQFNQFTDIIIGQANDVELSSAMTTIGIWNVVHADVKYDAVNVQTLIDRVTNGLLIGCSSQSTMPTSRVGTFTSGSTASLVSMLLCRSECYSQKLNVAVFQSATTCRCTDVVSWSTWSSTNSQWLSPTCTGSEPYLITWVSHLNLDPAVIPINLAVAVVYPVASRSTVYPEETVTFQISSSTIEAVTYRVDFGDGSDPLVTAGTTVGYSWSVAGQYRVNVTAANRFNVESRVQMVTVVPAANTGSAPVDLTVKADWDGKTDFGITAFVAAFSDKVQQCSVNYGDVSTVSSFNVPGGSVLSMNTTHSYPTVGLYPVTLTCSNQFGVANTTNLAPAVKSNVPYESRPLSVDVVLGVTGAGTGLIQTFVDGLRTAAGQARANSTHVVLTSALFSAIGEHSVALTQPATGLTLLKAIFNVIQPINDVQLTTTTAGVEVGEPNTVTLTIQKGNSIFVSLSYGDGQTDMVYLPSAPATVTRSHTYSALRTYNVTATVASDVGVVTSWAVASVERKIISATMTANNVTSLDSPTSFTFVVDPTVQPAMPITVDFQYGDGNAETVWLAPPYVHTFAYSRYGIYRVQATVRNNVSTSSLPSAVVQVGENITAVDLYVVNPLVAVNQTVTITVVCPTGSPVALEVDMGDGRPALRITRPYNYSPAKDDMIPTASRVAGSGNATTGTTRRRRQAMPMSAAVPFNVTYQYQKAGRYSIKATAVNSLTSATSHLCPDVVVISAQPSKTKCQPVASVLNAAPLGQPFVAQRSQVVSISASAQLQCSPSSSSQFPLYTWTVDRRVAGGSWRPELSVCVSASSSATLVIPSNTLWYGTYRINVTVSASTDGSILKLPASLDRSAPSTTYVTVVPTPLVANITVLGDSLEFYSNVTVPLIMSSSGDPDVIPGNATGYNMYVFCYPQQNQSVYDKMSLDQLLSQATNISSNSLENAAIYQFADAPCFSNLGSDLWMLEYEVHFPATYLVPDTPVVFVVYVTKDTRRANATVFGITSIPFGSSNISSALDDIDNWLKSGNTGAALAAMNAVTQQLNGGADDPEAVAQRTQMRGRLIGALGTVSNRVANIDQISKTANVMSSVVAKPSEVKPADKALAAEAVGNTAAAATSLAAQASESTVSDITQSMLTGVGNIMPFPETDTGNASSLTTAGPRSTTTRGPASTSTTASPYAGNSTDLSNVPTCCENVTAGLCDWIEPRGWMCVNEDDRKKTVWTEADCLLIFPDDINSFTDRFNAYNDELRRRANALKKRITTNGMDAFSNMGNILIDKQGEGSGKSLSSPNINMTVMKIDQQTVNTAKRRKREGKKGIMVNGINMPTDVVAKLSGGAGCQHIGSKNPFTYSDSPSTINGDAQTLALTGADGQPFEVTNSSEPFELWFDANPDPPMPSIYTLVGNATSYHRVNISDNGTAIMAVIMPPAGVILSVYIKQGDYPNASYYDEVSQLPNPPSSDKSRYLYYPSQNVTALNDSYVIGITVNSTTSGSDVSLDNYTISMFIYTAVCRFWNESLDAWDTNGCEVGPQTTASRTQCLCTHLTSFGGGFAVPPNTIDFATVFTAEKFLESMPVFSTVIAFIAAWVICCIWARHMDKKDIARWGAVPLEDNVPCDSYYYELSVYTGLRKNAGTSSKPSFILSGDDGDTGVRVLYDGKRKEHSTGSINNYILSVEDNLGALTFLRIWHDNHGKGSKRGWFLDQIHVTDLQTGEKFFFVCNRWMAVEEDDGQIERIIPVAGTNDLTQFGTMFTQSIRKKFSNDHMWASIFSRPTRSSFTRVQRVSSCIALLFLTMITNCMFFRSSDPDTATSVHIGPITITAQQIYISVVSTLIVLPPSVAIVTIFRKVRPKNNAIQSEKTVKSGGNKPGGWMSINPGSSLWQNGEGIDQLTSMQKMRDAVRKITSFHKRSKYSDDNDGGQADDDNNGAKKKKQPMSFPPWTIYIAWALVVLSVTVSGFFTILYSMQWGHSKSIDWLQTFLLSFVQNVIVVQPAKVFLLAMFLSCVLKKPDVEDEEIPGGGDNSLRPDEEAMAAATSRSQQDIQAILKRRRASQPGGEGLNLPNQEQLKRDREARLKQLEMDALIRECVVYIFFVLVTYFLAYQDKDKRSYTFSQNIQNNFFGSSDSNTAFSNKIQTYADVYSWMNETLFPNLYSNGWYNGQPASSWRDKQHMNDHVTIRLGIGRMRQLRIKDDTCKVLSSMKSLVNHCRNDYNWVDDDTKSYAPNWLPRSTLNETEECTAFEKPFDVWRYRNTVELRGTPYAGKINTYKGGGYTFNFRRDVGTTLIKFNELAQTDWLDVRTRAVFIEFTLYNGNANLFASVIMLVEFLATGGPVFTQEVKVFRISSYVGPFGAIVIIVQAIFVGFIIYFMVRSVRLIRKEKRAYFKSFWNCLELTTMITAIIAVAMYGMKLIMGNTAMDVLKEAGSGEYVNFVSIATWAEMFSFLLAFVVFMSTLKFIKMLKFNRRMAMLADTIAVATKDMKAFVITFFIYFLAFTQFAYLLFGAQMTGYSSVTQSIQSLFQFVLGNFDFVTMKITQPFLGPIFFFLYVIIVGIALQAMFLTIINEAFQKIRQESEYKKNDYEVVDYIMSKFKGVASIITGDRYGNVGGRHPEALGPSDGRGVTTGSAARRYDREVAEGSVEVGFE